jgi:16S rRNA (cytosine1402-N4)-methyltransferase
MHIAVMVEEVVELLKPVKGKILVDCTYGCGGHTKVFLKKGVKKVYAIDRDLETLEEFKIEDERIKFIWGNFKEIDKLVKEKVDGILFDLGVSSYQLEKGERGFSYKLDGTLDMRMDRSSGVPCYRLIKGFKIEDLDYVIKSYGEERYSRRIARLMVKELPTTTQELREIIRKVTPPKWRSKILRRVWQGLRIFVNDEINALKEGLEKIPKLLKLKGRVCVISYHSLEDRIVKKFFKTHPMLKMITKKPITPQEKEIRVNPRARSAKLRCAERVRK